MKKKYKLNVFDLEGYNKVIADFSRIAKVVGNKEFMNFVAERCMLELNRISNEKLGGIKEDDVTYSEVDKYRSNHKIDIGDDYVIISNSTMADLSHLSEKTLANYPDGLSIAKVIEFGTGIPGTNDDESGWVTQVNPKRNYEKGWYYQRNGRLAWSRGMEGKFIYQELLETVKKEFRFLGK